MNVLAVRVQPGNRRCVGRRRHVHPEVSWPSSSSSSSVGSWSASSPRWSTASSTGSASTTPSSGAASRRAMSRTGLRPVRPRGQARLLCPVPAGPAGGLRRVRRQPDLGSDRGHHRLSAPGSSPPSSSSSSPAAIAAAVKEIIEAAIGGPLLRARPGHRRIVGDPRRGRLRCPQPAPHRARHRQRPLLRAVGHGRRHRDPGRGAAPASPRCAPSWRRALESADREASQRERRRRRGRASGSSSGGQQRADEARSDGSGSAAASSSTGST